MTGKSRDTGSRKQPISKIGKQMPGNTKFGVTVALFLFWVGFLRSILNSIYALANLAGPILADLIMALVATALAYLILKSHRKIASKLKRIRL